MEILLVSNNADITFGIRRVLENIIGDEEVIMLNNPSEIISFISKYLITESKHLDLIIINEVQPSFYYNTDILYPQYKENYTKGLIQFINLNSDKTYSDSNFKLGCIPIAKICNSADDVSYSEKSYDFFTYCTDIQISYNLFPSVIKLIREFREIILLDLKDLELTSDNVFQPIKTNYALYRKDTNTRILSRIFIERQKKLNYYWFELSIKEIEFSINAFMDEISKSRRFQNKDEKKIHKFLKQNPNFLLRESYSNYYYEKQLYYPNTKEYIEPDFILNPKKCSFGTRTEIFEVKLPFEGIIKRKKQHQNPYSSFWDYLGQVKDYQEYFKMEEVQGEIIKKLGYLPKDYNFILLIGNKENKDENVEILNRRAKQFNFEDINILTYEELIEYQIRFINREKIIGTKSSISY